MRILVIEDEVKLAENLRRGLTEHGYIVEVEHPELGRTFRYPGAPYVFNGSPWSVRRRPPLVGEHTGEILRDALGLDAGEVAALAAEGII